MYGHSYSDVVTQFMYEYLGITLGRSTTSDDDTSSEYIDASWDTDERLAPLDKKYGHISEYWEMRPATEAMSRIDCLARAIEVAPEVADVYYFHAIARYKEIEKNDRESWGTGRHMSSLFFC